MWLGQLTAFGLVAHIATVIPAVALQLFTDADARVTSKHVGTSCKTGKRWRESRGGGRENKDGDKLSEGERQWSFTTSVMRPMLVPVDRSNYKSISVKPGDNIKSGGY